MNRFALKSIAAAALALPFVAQAATIFTFDTNGAAAGGQVAAAAFDQAPGNALALNGANTAANGATRLLYQANLNTVNRGDGNAAYLNGTNGYFFTFVVGFSEQTTSLTTDSSAHTATANFAFNGGQPSFFKMYANTVGFGNNLTGMGFTAGTEILSGTILADGFSSNFTEVLTAADARTASGNLDQSGNGNQHPGVTTVIGAGATSLRAQIDDWDPTFFPTFSAAVLTFSSTNTTQKTPFSEVDPSRNFSSDGIADGDLVNNIGAQNGITGPNFQFQADANSSFEAAAIPEPGTLALVGLALGSAGFAASRRRRS